MLILFLCGFWQFRACLGWFLVFVGRLVERVRDLEERIERFLC